MPQKLIVIADPGIDTAFAVALALHDPSLDVIGLIASAGNIPADRATQNVHLLINAVDPPKWPRLGAALPVEYEIDGTRLHGPDGLGNVGLPPVSLHAPTAGDKVIAELVRTYPHEVTVVNLGPGTMLAAAFDRDPDLPALIDRVVFLGGSWHAPGSATAVAEFHFFCDPPAARQVIRCGAPITLVPLDATRKLMFSPTDLLELPNPESATCTFLRRIVPFGIRASSNLYGIEGFHLKDVLGIVAVARPATLTTEAVYVDVETKGELTRGMLVVDTRPNPAAKPNVELVTNIDLAGVRGYIHTTLGRASNGQPCKFARCLRFPRHSVPIEDSRVHRVLCLSCVLGLVGPAAAAPPKSPTPAEPPSAAELAQIIKTLVTAAMPTPLHEQSFDWGRQHKVPNGITWEKDGILLKPKKQEKLKNEGMWRKLRVEAVDPDKNLTVQVANVKSPEKGKLTFDVVVSLPTRVKFEQQFWKSGVRLYSGRTRARVRPVLALKCESVSKVHKTDSLLPDVTFRLRVVDAKLSYDGFKVEHTAGVGGEMAETIGNAAHDTLKLIRPNLEKDLLAKANKAVIKAGDTKEIKLGLGKLLDGK